MTKVYWAKADILENEAMYEKAHSFLNETRKAKADRIVAHDSRIASVAAWTLLRYAMKLEGIEINEEEMEFGQNGKPSLVSKKTHFNLSHAKNGLVVCTISSESVGIDVERIAAHDMKIAKRYFAPAEYSILKRSNNQDVLFTRLWTMKESILKRLGSGLATPLRLYDFSSCEESSFDLFGCHFDVYEIEGNVITVSSLTPVESIEEVDFQTILK
ncbi:MAG: 4'-phosphopantetheinyl transferase superfamily protein [Bacilli bacterium]|nr:4'-phosphopantetheinyl transferase superfamily protein [Bacilli bacterium]